MSGLVMRHVPAFAEQWTIILYCAQLAIATVGLLGTYERRD
jgi:hypothetical protein